MKKKFYFLLFAIMISVASTAQRFEYQLGLKGAMGMGWLAADNDSIGSENGLCYKFGLTGVYYFGENYGITSGFNIMGNNMSSVSNTFVQVPFLLKMRTDNFAEKFRFCGEIGYGLDLFLKDNGKKEFRLPYRDVCSSFILHLGMEIEVLNRSTLQLMACYDTFFSNMLSKGNDKLTMSNLCFEIGFLF